MAKAKPAARAGTALGPSSSTTTNLVRAPLPSGVACLLASDDVIRSIGTALSPRVLHPFGFASQPDRL